MTTPRPPAELAKVIEDAHNVLIRWHDYDALRTLRWEEKDIIVAALRAYRPDAAKRDEDASR